ncbi:glycosyl hydrolase, family 20 [gut metagenome]|uniref:Glycosyl hydrolase, family 20 n=1 Tax=gut metagenome TaxID=749906 RepID=J9GKZ2_9ZZZZ
MKKFFMNASKVIACLIFSVWSTSLWAEVNPKPFVIPELTTWTGAEGEFVPSGRLAVKGGKQAVQVAEAFARDYKEITGKDLKVVKGGGKAGDFVLNLKKDESLGREGYRMEVGEKAVITAHTAQGLFWGTRTLLQLSEQSDRCALPKGSSVDIPEYEMRGFMMDCGRKFIPMDYMRNLVKIMAYYKMNTLQVHLNDNGFRQYFGDDWMKTQAAFRLESTTYPGLTAKDGSYSKQEFIDFQILAENNFVEVIPEIDVPAHCLAFTQYKPEIGSKEYGMDHLDLFNPETYKFVDGLFKEYLSGDQPVFRGKRVHVGTDEYSNANKNVVEKFREFTDRYLKLVESYGKQPMCWGALTHAKGETPVKVDNVIMSCWFNGFAQPKEMKKLGYKLISIPDGLVYIVPAAGYYYDYLNCQYLYNSWTPATIGGEKFEENDPAVMGGMFAVWNDHCGNGISVKDIHHRVYPAMQTLAVKCWTGKHTSVPYETFNTKRLALSEAPAVNENATYGTEQKEVFHCATVTPGMEMPYKEIGYNYTVSFTVEVQDEAKGTELFRSSNAVFYLSDPRTGQLGFARDGYLNHFNYRLPKGQKVNITIQGDNRQTILWVNGERKQVMDPITCYAMKANEKIDFQYGVEHDFKPVVYTPNTKMYYQRTLVFPFEKAGNFKSKVTDLKVYNYIK